MGPIIRKRSKRIIGPRLMDRSLRTLLGNRGSDTERSPLGGLKLMVTWSVSCKPSRRVREFLNLKEKLFGMECKERLATIAPRPTQQQRKALTCSCSVESYGGSYRKGSYLQEKFHTTQSDKETRLKRSKWKSTRQEAERPGKPYSGWRPSSFEAEQSRCSHPSIWPPTLLSNRRERKYDHREKG